MKTRITGRALFWASLVGMTITTMLLSETHVGNAQAGQPDLTVESTNVWVSPQRPIGGDIVALKAAIRNLGETDAVGVTVDFTDNADGATQMPVSIGSTTVDVPAGGTSIAHVMWDTSGELADNIITVSIDTGNLIAESDEGNNQTNATMFVSTASGDINCIGGVNSVDALAILRWKAGLDYNQLTPCPVPGQ
jgi:subtilase family serine protease